MSLYSAYRVPSTDRKRREARECSSNWPRKPNTKWMRSEVCTITLDSINPDQTESKLWSGNESKQRKEMSVRRHEEEEKRKRVNQRNKFYWYVCLPPSVYSTNTTDTHYVWGTLLDARDMIVNNNTVVQGLLSYEKCHSGAAKKHTEGTSQVKTKMKPVNPWFQILGLIPRSGVRMTK